MGCNTLVEPACRVVGHLIHSGTSTAAGGVLDAIAQAMTDGVRWVVVNTATWWLQIPSPDLANEPAVAHIQQWLLPITVAIAAGGLMAAGVRMALTRRANPLIDVTGGLLTLAAATTLGVAITTVLLKAGDAWSAWVLQESTGGQFTRRLELVLGLGGSPAPAVVVIFSVIAILLSLVQAILMLFRQAALVILAGVLPLAAAGSIAPMTRPWVRKVAAWMLALICYKPAAAAVYAAAFTMTGSGRSLQTTLMGFVLLVLSVVALPALMKFFTWTTGTIGAPGGGGGLLNAVTVGAIAAGALRSPGAAGAAQEQAFHINAALGPPGGGAAPAGDPPPDGPGPAGPPAGPTPSGPAGAGPVSDGPSGAPAGAPRSGRRPPPWPGPPPPGMGSGTPATPGGAATSGTSTATPGAGSGGDADATHSGAPGGSGPGSAGSAGSAGAVGGAASGAGG